MLASIIVKSLNQFMSLTNLIDSQSARRFRGVQRRKPAAAVGRSFTEPLERRLVLSAVNMTDYDQLLLELVNRARSNPSAEAARYGIGLNDGLPADTISTAPKQPLAPHQLLVNAAGGHSQDMLNRDFFEHNTPDNPPLTPSDRLDAVGYNWNSNAENIGWKGTTGTLNQLTSLQSTHEGLVKSAGHRRSIMNPEYEEFGTGVKFGVFTTPDNSGITRDFNAIMVTESFGRRNLNPFITGVVYTDSDNDQFYSLNEAIRSGTITARNTTTGLVYSETIGTSGGYGLSVPAGSYTISARYRVGGTDVIAIKNQTVEADNVKVDFVTGSATLVGLSLSPAVTSLQETGSPASTTVTITRTGDFGTAVTFTLGTSDSTETTVPSSVTIPAGEASATFTVSAVNDLIIDGNQLSTITATATGYPSANRSFTTIDRTVPVLPATLQTSTTARPRIAWTGISNAATYDIWINNVSTGESQVIRTNGLTSPEFTPPADLPLGRYRVWVRGYTSAGLAGAWSQSQDWQIKSVPLVNGHNSTESSGSFAVSWSELAGATTYDVWIDRLTSNTSQYLRNTSVSGTSLNVTNFDLGQYAVWVRGRNAQGELGNFSSRIVITVNLTTSGLNVTSSAFNGTPVLAWGSVPGATQYEVWVNNLTTNTSKVVHQTTVAGTSLSLTGLTAGSYRAWVRARDSKGGNYAWSDRYDFEVQSATRVLTPFGSGNSAIPTFSWSAVSGAARYELWVTHMNSLVRVIHLPDLNNTSYESIASLDAGNYRVWVRAIDSNDSPAAWSAPVDFSISQTDTIGLDTLLVQHPLERSATTADEFRSEDELFANETLLNEVLLTRIDAEHHAASEPSDPAALADPAGSENNQPSAVTNRADRIAAAAAILPG